MRRSNLFLPVSTARWLSLATRRPNINQMCQENLIHHTTPPRIFWTIVCFWQSIWGVLKFFWPAVNLAIKVSIWHIIVSIWRQKIFLKPTISKVSKLKSQNWAKWQVAPSLNSFWNQGHHADIPHNKKWRPNLAVNYMYSQPINITSVVPKADQRWHHLLKSTILISLLNYFKNSKLYSKF